MAEGASTQVKSATRTLDIIEFVIARARPVVAQDIADALSIPVSSLSYLLSTLVEREYLTRDGRRYCAGPGLERLQVRAPSFSLAEMVAPLTRTLRVQLDETSSFFVRRGWEIEALVTETSQQALRYAVQPGMHAALHGFAAGKALLAELGEDELAKYFQETDRRPFTDMTVTSESGLRDQIAQIRLSGIARTSGEFAQGIVGFAKVARLDEKVVGAFSVAFPEVRHTAELEERAVLLLGKAATLLDGK